MLRNTNAPLHARHEKKADQNAVGHCVEGSVASRLLNECRQRNWRRQQPRLLGDDLLDEQFCHGFVGITRAGNGSQFLRAKQGGTLKCRQNGDDGLENAARFRAGGGPHCCWARAVESGDAHEGARLGTRQRRGVGRQLPEVVAALAVERAPRWRRCRLSDAEAWAAAALRSTAAVLAATRARAWIGCRRRRRTVRASALRTRGEGWAVASEGSAAPASGRGGRAGFPKPSDRVPTRRHRESDRARRRGGAEVTRWACLSCDSCLLE